MLEFLYKALTRVHEDEEGQTLIEYSLIAALVAVALIAALNLLAIDIGEIFTAIGAELDGAI
jgi:pilus assembly protein Flp/PilA